MKDIFLALVLLSALAAVQCLRTNLTLFEISPCGGDNVQTVSRFKSDIYAVKPSFEKCKDFSWWQKGRAYNKTGLRVRSWIQNSSITIEKAAVFVSRQGISDISSWAIPFKPQGFEMYFHDVDRTMCPGDIMKEEEEQEEEEGDDEDESYLFYVDVFSSSVEEVAYGIRVDVVPQFVLQLDEPVTVMAGASSPQIFYFRFPEGSSIVTVQADTSSKRCILFSVQKNKCPINDLLETARSRGIYQTMSTSAFLTVSEEQVENREFVVVMITTNYSECHKEDLDKKVMTPPGNSSAAPDYLGDKTEYAQNVTITIHNLERITNFVLPIFLPFLVFGVYIILICLYAFVLPRCYLSFQGKKFEHKLPRGFYSIYRKCCKKVEVEISDENVKLLSGQSNSSVAHYSSLDGSGKDGHTPGMNGSTSTEVTVNNADLLQYSISQDSDESNHTLPRMCKVGHHKLQKQYTVYSWNTFTVGIFYALPAFQLVLSDQEILFRSGDQDKCYYNFKCAHPLGVLSAFNNVWSNVGYVLLGVLFFVVVWYRDSLYRKKRKEKRQYMEDHGVPQFYGIYYGMAIALILEGFMSAFYHICPTNANFQFDTAFMFIIGGLFLVKLFQKRHPDINANAFIAFFTFAIVIFMTLIGLYVDMHHPYAIRTAVFGITLVVTLVFLVSFYNFHLWPACSSTVKSWCSRKKDSFSLDETSGRILCYCPRKKCRFVRFLLVGLVNAILFAVFLCMHEYLDIATSVLAFFIANLMLFLVMYVVMKLRYCERLTVLPLFLILVTGLLWLFAFFFFMGLTTTDWLLTPAESRDKNEPCALLGFYDYHDIWHFFSASAMFFSFSFLLTLDDGVLHTPRNKLHIF